MAKAANPTYPANVREFVRRLHGRGRTAYAIRKQLQSRGVDPAPSESTILRWADEDYAEADRLRNRRFGKAGPPRAMAWEVRLDRMKALRSVRLSFNAVAAVMNLDCDDLDLTGEQARGILAGDLSTRTARALLDPATAVAPRLGRPRTRGEA